MGRVAVRVERQALDALAGKKKLRLPKPTFSLSMRGCHQTPVRLQLGYQHYAYGDRRHIPLSRAKLERYDPKPYDDEGKLQAEDVRYPTQTVLEGVVTSVNDSKTRTVLVRKWRWFSKYQVKKRWYRKYWAHDEQEVSNLGDYVVIKELRKRKLSKRKWFYITEIQRRAERDLLPREGTAKSYTPGTQDVDRNHKRGKMRKLDVRRSGVYCWVHRHLQARKKELYEQGKIDEEELNRFYF